MKKKLFSLLIGLFAVILITGCGAKKIDKEEISLKDDTLKYKTTFEFEKADGFKLEKEETGGKYKEIIMKNELENLKFDMYYSDNSDDAYKSLKEDRSTKKNYKEYKYGKYDAYVYSDYDSDLNLIIKLTDEKNKVISLYVYIETINFDNSDVVYEMFNREVIQNFFNSIELTVE